jgi:hypothetical protein
MRRSLGELREQARQDVRGLPGSESEAGQHFAERAGQLLAALRFWGQDHGLDDGWIRATVEALNIEEITAAGRTLRQEGDGDASNAGLLIEGIVLSPDRERETVLLTVAAALRRL